MPTNLAGVSNSSTTVNLTWTASTDNVAVAGYRVYRGGTLVGSPTTNSYTDTGLTTATSYSYTVAAADTAGNLSAQTAAVNVTTQLSGAQTRNVTNAATLTTALGEMRDNPEAIFTINLAGGTYTLGATALPNLVKDTKIQGPTSGTAATIDGTAQTGKVIFKVTGTNVTIANVKFTNGTAALIQSTATNGTFKNCIVIGNTDNPAVEGIGCSGWTITGNGISAITSSVATADPAIFFYAGATTTTITNNIIVGCDVGIGYGTGAADSVGGGTIRNNMISDTRTTGYAGPGIKIESNTGTATVVDNNTVYQAGANTNAIEYNNCTVALSVRNNLVAKLITGTNSTAPTLATWFVAPASGDLHLASAVSGVVDSGTAIAGFIVDIDGDSRPLNSGYEICADEYYVAPAPTPAPAPAQSGGGGGGGAPSLWFFSAVLVMGATRRFYRR